MNIINEIMIAGAVSGAISAGLGYYFANRRYTRDLGSHYEMFKKIRRSAIKNLARQTGAANVLILEMKNGGGLLKHDSPWASSVIDEWPRAAQYSAKDDWQNIPILPDTGYRNLIMDVQRRGKEFLHVDMEIDAFLKGAYIRMGITASVIVELYRSPYSYHYMSVTFSDHPESTVDPVVVNHIDTMRMSLQDTYSHYQAVGVMHLDSKN